VSKTRLIYSKAYEFCSLAQAGDGVVSSTRRPSEIRMTTRVHTSTLIPGEVAFRCYGSRGSVGRITITPRFKWGAGLDPYVSRVFVTSLDLCMPLASKTGPVRGASAPPHDQATQGVPSARPRRPAMLPRNDNGQMNEGVSAH